MAVPILNGAAAVHDRLTDTANRHVSDTLRTCALAERVTWETALQLANGPQGPAPVLAIYLRIPSPLLGQCLIELVLIEAPQANQVTITQAVAEAIARLFTARAKATAFPSGSEQLGAD